MCVPVVLVLLVLLVRETRLQGNVVGNTCKYDDVDIKCEGGTELVMGGRTVNNKQYPFLVSIQKERYEGCFEHMCGGTMITPELLLTAAHCFDKYVDPGTVESIPSKRLYVAHNPKCRHQNNDQLPRAFVDTIYIPEGYDRASEQNDIAIASVFGCFEGELIDISNADDPVPSDLKGEVVGYGISRPEEFELFNVSPLQAGNGSVLEENICEYFLGGTLAKFLDYSTMFCTRDIQTTTCKGDSGGPFLVQQDGGSVKQLGVVSWGPAVKCANISGEQGVTVFTSLSPFTDWIQTIVDVLALMVQ